MSTRKVLGMTSNSMGSTHDLSSIWTVLAAAPGITSELAVAPLGLAVRAGEILVGIDENTNRHLLVPLLPGEAFAAEDSSRTVHLVGVEHAGTKFMSAVCLSRDLDDIFSQFCRELVLDIQLSDSPARDTRAALARWRDLFSKDGVSGLLSANAQLGLFGELTLLKRLLEGDLLGRTDCWKGPAMSQHDFRWAGVAIEVKATRSREGRRIPISSVEQLVSPHYRFEDDPVAGSLADLVGVVENLSADRDAFREQLGVYGYDTRRADAYATLRLREKEFRMYDVNGVGFPRITPVSFVGGRVPAGTEALSYTVDLSNEPPHPLTEIDVAGVLAQAVLK